MRKCASCVDTNDKTMTWTMSGGFEYVEDFWNILQQYDFNTMRRFPFPFGSKNNMQYFDLRDTTQSANAFECASCWWIQRKGFCPDIGVVVNFATHSWEKNVSMKPHHILHHTIRTINPISNSLRCRRAAFTTTSYVRFAYVWLCVFTCHDTEMSPLTGWKWETASRRLVPIEWAAF